MPPVEPPRKHAANGTQTEASEFLDLRTLQMASAGQQDDIVALRRDLQQAIANSASAMHTATAVLSNHIDRPNTCHSRFLWAECDGVWRY